MIFHALWSVRIKKNEIELIKLIPDRDMYFPFKYSNTQKTLNIAIWPYFMALNIPLRYRLISEYRYISIISYITTSNNIILGCKYPLHIAKNIFISFSFNFSTSLTIVHFQPLFLEKKMLQTCARTLSLIEFCSRLIFGTK